MLPTLEGIIARRVLLNFRADAEVARRLVPAPLEVVTHNGFAVVGVCLIRLEQLRPRGFPAQLGLSSENMAHRIAIRYPSGRERKDGVFIWRRETDQRWITLLGGRLFPGVHGRGEFRVTENDHALSFDVHTEHREADVSLHADLLTAWEASSLFRTFPEVCEFFRKGECGFSCSLRSGKLEGIRLRTLKWEMIPLRVASVHSSFYQNPERFPPGSVAFDCGVVMRSIPHEWHELDSVPELAGL